MNSRTVAQLFKLELDYMFNQWEAAKPLRIGAPHASSILQAPSEWCLRRQVLLALYPEQAKHPESKPWDAHTNAVFLNGWLLHEKYQRLFQDHARVVEVETSHYDETRYLHFTPDAVIEYAGQRYVVEIKGYKQETFEKLEESSDPPEGAHKQCNLYMHILGIERGIVLVENKNTQQYKVWIIEHDATLAQEYTDRMYSVKGAVLTRRIPVRACTSKTDRRAEKCPMKALCFSGGLER
jgi:hypothetical protein